MTIIENVRVIHFWPPQVSDPVDIAIQDRAEGGRIVALGADLGKRWPEAQRVCGPAYASPGLVCGHTHLYSTLARGLTADIKPAADFVQTLQHLWWRLDRAIDEPILKASALAGCAEAALCGVTSLVDHHSSPECIADSLSVISLACESVGPRGLLCYEVTDRNGPAGAKAGIAENRRFAEELDGRRRAGEIPFLEAAIGAHASFTLGEASLDALAQAVADTGRGLHIHAAEDRYDASDCRARHGQDIAVRLDRAGCLDAKTNLGHGVWLTAAEIALVNGRDAFIAHNPRSNMNNRVGYADQLPGMRNLVLGTDGIDSNMLTEFRFAWFKHRDSGGPLSPDFFLAALDRGNRLLERHFGSQFGRIEPGFPADLVLWDYDPPTPLSAANLGGHLAFGLDTRHIHSVFTGGRAIVENRRPAFDADAIFAHAREEASRLWKRL
jgi:putative selenium metabolism protein SsnA